MRANGFGGWYGNIREETTRHKTDELKHRFLTRGETFEIYGYTDTVREYAQNEKLDEWVGIFANYNFKISRKRSSNRKRDNNGSTGGARGSTGGIAIDGPWNEFVRQVNGVEDHRAVSKTTRLGMSADEIKRDNILYDVVNARSVEERFIPKTKTGEKEKTLFLGGKYVATLVSSSRWSLTSIDATERNGLELDKYFAALKAEVILTILSILYF